MPVPMAFIGACYVFAKMKINANNFWFPVVFLILVKLALISGNPVQIAWAPHDDGLYMLRAFYLVMDGSMGPYDSKLLIKLPGISLWMAGSRLLGIPYMLSINLLFILSGIYFVTALRRFGVNHLLVLLVFVVYLFHPVTFQWQWFRVSREPLAVSLLVLLLGSMLFVLNYLRNGHLSAVHMGVFAVVFAFSLLVREEDRLLYVLFIMFILLVVWHLRTGWQSKSPQSRVGVMLILVAPLLCAFFGNAIMRSYVQHYYGVPLLYDFGEGEFPRLIAAIRGVESRQDSRHVMISQEALQKIRAEVPIFAPVIDRLPPPGPKSYSCERFNICDEWTNGWMLFWIKDAAFNAGLAPTLLDSQVYFLAVRRQIERACEESRLKCVNKGSGLIPPFELKWSGALLSEAAGVVQMMMMPRLGLVEPPPHIYPVNVDFGRAFQMVTMSDRYDSQLQALAAEDAMWKAQPKSLHLSLRYWLNYPDVAGSEDFGPGAGKLGAMAHYQRHGQQEGRIWQHNEYQEATLFQFKGLLDSWKPYAMAFGQRIGIGLEVLGILAFLVRLGMWRAAPLTPLTWLVILFTAFTLVRVIAMSYVSVYMGGLDDRLFFSTYVGAFLLAPLIIADTIETLFLRAKAHLTGSLV